MLRDRQVATHEPPTTPIAGVLDHLCGVDEHLEADRWWADRALERLTLFHTLAGSVVFTAGGHGFTAGPGSLVVLAAGCRFTERTPAAGTWWHPRYLMLSGPLVEPLQRALARHPSLASVHEQAPPAWTRALDACVRLALRTPPAWEIELLHHLAGLLHGVARLPAPPAEPDLLARVARLVDAEPADPWPVARLARALNLGASSFAQRFAAAAGCPPARWIRDRRLDRAAILLADGATLAAAAEALGFCDAFHLSRCYRARFGASPAHHRRAAASPLHRGTR